MTSWARRLGEALLTPHPRSTSSLCWRCIDAADVHGVSHITGGGFYENIPALHPRRASRASIDKAAIRTPAHLRSAPGQGRHPRARYVQHLQHGRGHDRRRRPGTDADGALAALRAEGMRRLRHAARSSPAKKRCDRYAGRQERAIAVLVSGGGTNLQALLDAQAAGALPHGEITLVVSSSKPAPTPWTRAANAGIPRADDAHRKQLRRSGGL